MATKQIDLEKAVSRAFLLFLLLVFVGTNPLPHSGSALAVDVSEGNLVRQIAFVSSFLLIAAFSGAVSVRRLPVSVPISWAALLVWAAMSTTWAIEPDISMRRFLFMLIVVLCVVLAVVHSRSEYILQSILAATAVVVVIDLAAVLFMAEKAVHARGALDGAWRGVHIHKNIAGQIAAISAIAWFWHFVVRRTRLSLFFLAASIVLLVGSGSKTSIALCLFTLGLCYAIHKGRSDRLTAVLAAAGVFVLLTLFLVLEAITASGPFEVLGSITFTGRTVIWEKLIAYSQSNLLLGAGYGSFWQIGPYSPIVALSEDWAQKAPHGHNGFLDILVTLGLPGLLLVVWAFIAAPIKAYLGNPDRYSVIVSVFLNLWMFGILHNLTESTLFNRSRAAGVFLLIGAIGLIVLNARSSRTQSAQAPAGARGSLWSSP